MRTLLLVLILHATAVAAARGQGFEPPMPVDSLREGAAVRVTAPSHELTRARAVFGGFASEGLFFRLRTPASTIVLAQEEISELVMLQRRSFVVPGLVVGTALGMTATVGIMSGFAEQSFAESLPILGGGVLLGLLVGSAFHRTWERRVDLGRARHQ